MSYTMDQESSMLFLPQSSKSVTSPFLVLFCRSKATLIPRTFSIFGTFLPLVRNLLD